MKTTPIKATTPIVFSDGASIYRAIINKYNQHKKGLFILAPSGTGKTHYVNNQKDSDWIDGDMLWVVTGADYSSDKWNDSFDDVMEINARSDIITHQAKKLGLRILGSSNLFLQPDAIVIPNWKKHRKYISKREKNDYDGGATEADLDGVKMHIRWIKDTWEGKVPFFASIEEAVQYLEERYDDNTK